MYEQVYIAALEFGDIDLVDVCSEALNKRFPDSVRVKRLLGMQYEFNKEYKKALDLYNNLLQSNPSNLLVLKRKVCNSILPFFAVCVSLSLSPPVPLSLSPSSNYYFHAISKAAQQ